MMCGMMADTTGRAEISVTLVYECGVDLEIVLCFFFQAEDGIRDLVRSRGLGDVYKRQKQYGDFEMLVDWKISKDGDSGIYLRGSPQVQIWDCLLYTSDAADERSSVDLGGRRIIKKTKRQT